MLLNHHRKCVHIQLRERLFTIIILYVLMRICVQSNIKIVNIALTQDNGIGNLTETNNCTGGKPWNIMLSSRAKSFLLAVANDKCSPGGIGVGSTQRCGMPLTSDPLWDPVFHCDGLSRALQLDSSKPDLWMVDVLWTTAYNIVVWVHLHCILIMLWLACMFVCQLIHRVILMHRSRRMKRQKDRPVPAWHRTWQHAMKAW